MGRLYGILICQVLACVGRIDTFILSESNFERRKQEWGKPFYIICSSQTTCVFCTTMVFIIVLVNFATLVLCGLNSHHIVESIPSLKNQVQNKQPPSCSFSSHCHQQYSVPPEPLQKNKLNIPKILVIHHLLCII